MTIKEIIAKLEVLQEEYGNVEVEVLTDEGDAVEVNIHIEENNNTKILCLYY
jgi:hypothetical protein